MNVFDQVLEEEEISDSEEIIEGETESERDKFSMKKSSKYENGDEEEDDLVRKQNYLNILFRISQ